MRLKQVGATLVGAAAVTMLAAGPALAATTTFEVSSGLGTHSARGSFTWLNRSVQVQGEVKNIGGAGTQVGFEAWVGGMLVDSQNRPTQGKFAVNETVPYNFTLDGSAYPGGITKVGVWLYNAHTASWSGPTEYFRP
ncbi:hypothetical protein [Streptomyces alboniger]|uniref:hypothetical protein n=1 Tax=Streptomyces alboniger TaxID=132473 RepID=UPI000A7D1BDC|nr:hypothetical protein [Streptomyces alboniger]